jgi:hypothetical protein
LLALVLRVVFEDEVRDCAALDFEADERGADELLL